VVFPGQPFEVNVSMAATLKIRYTTFLNQQSVQLTRYYWPSGLWIFFNNRL